MCEPCASVEEWEYQPPSTAKQSTPPLSDGLAERLQRFEAACIAIWPAIRFFGVGGAYPQYVEAMHEIGRLIGRVDVPQPMPDIDGIRAMAYAAGRQSLVSELASSDSLREVVGRRMHEQVAEIAGQLLQSGNGGAG